MPRDPAADGPRFRREALLWFGACLGVAILALSYPQLAPFRSPLGAGYLTPRLLIELAPVVMSVLIASFAWHALDSDDIGSTNLLMLGFSVLAVLNLMHALTIDGMPPFLGLADTQRSLFFFLCSRLAEVLVFAAFALGMRLRRKRGIWLLAAALIAAAVVWWDSARPWHFPTLFVPGDGATPLEQRAVLLLCIGHLIAGGLLWQAAGRGRSCLYVLSASALILALGDSLDLPFQIPSPSLDIVSHLLEVIAYMLAYRVVSIATLASPHERLKRSEALVRQRESELRAVIDSLPFPACVRDVQLKLTFTNPAFASIWGTLLGPELDEDLLPPTVRARWEDSGQRALAGEVVTRESDYRIGMDVRTMHSIIGPVRNAGRITGIVSVNIDVTEREMAKHEAIQNAALLRTFIKHVPASVAMLDRETRIIYVSDEWARAFGMEGRDVTGYTYEELFPHFPRESQEHFLALSGEVVRNEQQEIRYPDRESDWVQWEMRPWHRQDGTIGGVMVFSLIITQRVKAQMEVERLNAELETRVRERTSELAVLNAELEEFSASVSHDLRSPLRNIEGYLALLKEEPGDIGDTSRHYVDTVLRETGRATRLIDALLNLARIGRAAPDLQRVDLNALVIEVLDSLARDAEGRRIKWRVAPLPTVIADRSLLWQVFVNLISNALKFTAGRDPAVIDIGVASRDLRPGQVVIFIRDNGVGFDMDSADRLFGAFQRLHPEREFKGTGIGLANVKRIVQRHGGSVWAESRVDGGATFYFSLPLREPQQLRDERAFPDAGGLSGL
jgi:PAS domain S-box-containing protein